MLSWAENTIYPLTQRSHIQEWRVNSSPPLNYVRYVGLHRDVISFQLLVSQASEHATVFRNGWLNQGRRDQRRMQHLCGRAETRTQFQWGNLKTHASDRRIRRFSTIKTKAHDWRPSWANSIHLRSLPCTRSSLLTFQVIFRALSLFHLPYTNRSSLPCGNFHGLYEALSVITVTSFQAGRLRNQGSISVPWSNRLWGPRVEGRSAGV